jgi:hypothetical protein
MKSLNDIELGQFINMTTFATNRKNTWPVKMGWSAARDIRVEWFKPMNGAVSDQLREGAINGRRRCDPRVLNGAKDRVGRHRWFGRSQNAQDFHVVAWRAANRNPSPPHNTSTRSLSRSHRLFHVRRLP